LRGGELEDTGLLGDDGALVLGRQAGDQLCHVSAGLLWVQVANLLGNINDGGENLVVALLGSFFEGAASSADLNGELLAASVSHKLSRLFLHILGCAGRLIDSLADLLTLTIAFFLHRSVALIHLIFKSLLLESDRARLLKCFLTNFFLRRFKLSNISVVALLCVLVGTLQDGLLLQGGHCLLLVHAAQPSIRIGLTTTEVNSTRNC